MLPKVNHMEEEKKTIENEEVKEESKTEEVPSEPESDFADEVKEEKPAEEKPVEEAPKEEEPEINLYKEEEDVVTEEAPAEPKEKGKKEEVVYNYSDDNLVAIEKARSDFHNVYKKENIIKWIVTAVALVLIVLGYVLPNVIPGLKENQASLYITLAVLLVAIVVLGVYSFVSRKKIDKLMNEYFAKYYDFTNAYAFSELGVSNMVGGVNDKIKPEDLTACGLYNEVVKVGSRDLISFDYHDEKIKVVDCAAQTKGAKNSLRTVFVGKMVVAPNHYDGDDIIVYLKGNKRALPPTALKAYNLLEDHKEYCIYGKSNSKKGLTKKALEAIKELKTDKTLVDVAVNLRAGNTYFLLGYEDDLMVLPLDKAFNPAPTEHYHHDMKLVFGAIDAINGYKD